METLLIGKHFNKELLKNDCWASVLGDCEGKISREHLVSASLFPGKKKLNVSGFQWCKGDTKHISIKNLTSKILCTRHNSLLTSIDSAAGNSFDVLNKIVLLTNARQVIDPPKFKVRSFYINGFLLERWFLKTLINLCRETSIHLNQQKKIIGVPSEHYVRVCFGKEKFQGKSGLYLVSHIGATLEFKPEIGFIPIISESDAEIVGGFFYFRGFLFFLSLMEEPLPNNFDWLSGIDLPFESKNLIPSWHFRKATFKVNGYRSHKVIFKW